MKAPTIAITGAAGYIGSCIVKQIQRNHPSWNITAIDNFYLGDVRQIGDVNVLHVDIRDRERLYTALEGADVVMHLAAISGVEDCANNRDLAYEVNVLGTGNVAWFCRDSGINLIFPYSMGVIGDPQRFPITVDHPREPLNWYGRTKLLGEQVIETMAQNAYPAHLFMKSNLYGRHLIDGEYVSKGTVTNFFLERALNGETLTVYEPGTQARNYIHVKDVSNAYIRSAEQLLEQRRNGNVDVERYEIASDEDPSVMEVAEMVARVAKEERGIEVNIELIANPRAGETMVESFEVDTTKSFNDLNWSAEHTLEQTIRERLQTTQG
ncbi:NAD-dependent epimerase/dehydratase family protein [Halococcus salsus]|uniref:NAD-dependent epimerase/dehydratase family protein n=1 Tax=Halococcus salsus TaxID=2162894 RepID=UPI00135C3DDB|nr:NAD-dependent epimerase/dehydratase family protein [Halococcus salsus]